MPFCYAVNNRIPIVCQQTLFFLGRVNFYQNITCNKTANLVEIVLLYFYGVYRMRSRLISVLQQSVQRSQKFADYNFRNYFVAKYATKLEQVETDTFGPITEEILNKAEADLEMLIRQTTIQEINHSSLCTFGIYRVHFWIAFPCR